MCSCRQPREQNGWEDRKNFFGPCVFSQMCSLFRLSRLGTETHERAHPPNRFQTWKPVVNFWTLEFLRPRTNSQIFARERVCIENKWVGFENKQIKMVLRVMFAVLITLNDKSPARNLWHLQRKKSLLGDTGEWDFHEVPGDLCPWWTCSARSSRCSDTCGDIVTFVCSGLPSAPTESNSSNLVVRGKRLATPPWNLVFWEHLEGFVTF